MLSRKQLQISMRKIISEIKSKAKSRSLLKEERTAAKYIIREYEEAKKFLLREENKVNNKKVEEIINKRKIEELTDMDLEKLEPYLSIIYSQGVVKKRLIELRYLIWAFYFLITGKNEIEALHYINTKRWRFKHEVIIRLAWMRRQKVLILKGNQFNHPFLCYVGNHKGRRNTDREFFSVMTFISLYSKDRKVKYLFDSIPSSSVPSQPRPDFIIKDEIGNRTGIEITEANLQTNSHFDDSSLEKLQEVLNHTFKKKKFALILENKPNWRLINENLLDVINWIKTEAVKAEKIFPTHEEFSTKNISYNMYLKFKKSDLFLFNYSGEEVFGNILEEDIGISIKERIESKIKKAKPGIRPCYLVIFMRASIPFMNIKIIRATARKGLDKNFKSHFDQIWAVKEEKLFRVA